MAVLVGVGCCHEMGILARLVSDTKPEQHRIRLAATFDAHAVLPVKFRDSRSPDLERLLAPLSAKERISAVAIGLSRDSLHVATIESQIAARKIPDPENVAEPHPFEERKAFGRQHPVGRFEEVSMTRPDSPGPGMLLTDVPRVMLGPPTHITVRVNHPTSHCCLLGGLE